MYDICVVDFFYLNLLMILQKSIYCVFRESGDENLVMERMYWLERMYKFNWE